MANIPLVSWDIRRYKTVHYCARSSSIFFSCSNSFSFSIRVERHFWSSARTARLASSRRSASSFSICSVNSGVPPLLASRLATFARWKGTGFLRVRTRGVGGC
ncbi:unnamed protein product [Mycena citricolor]|uniref:Uncharacterized protein n=1 Tax=Mycena citricolor TaxID=2018698 RepID=A0AAD2HED5_9AGAR|nr:unnamed protein product [Mycena citricolor]CAK5275159.1 unnamed protein product [Mycena citricolor]